MTCAKPGCSMGSVGKSKYCRDHRDEAHAQWVETIGLSAQARDARDAKWEALHAAADRAGNEAALTCTPTPMVVVQHSNQLDDNSPVTQSWLVEGGVCGFAWVVIRPGTCSFARWAKKHVPLTDKHYHGGVSVWCPLGTQSMAIKEAYCHAYARTLNAAGIDAYAGSRMD